MAQEAEATTDFIAWLKFFYPTMREAVLILETEDGNLLSLPVIRMDVGASPPPGWNELGLLKRAVEMLERSGNNPGRPILTARDHKDGGN